MNRLVLLIILATVLGHGYLVVASGTEFVFDDQRFVEKNEAVQDLGNPLRYFTDPTTLDPRAWTGIYRPLRTLDFAIDWAIAGPSPWWYHLKNVLIHLVGTLLAFALLRRWGAGDVGATIGALIFSLHPVQVEAVGWITSRGDLLFFAFFAAALLFHQRSRGNDGHFYTATGFLVLSLLSKEVAVVFPAAAFLADFFFRDERRFSRTKGRWPQYLTYAVLALLYVAVWSGLHVARDAPRWHVQERWGGSLFATLLMMSRGFVYYFRLILLPADMAIDFYVTPVKTLDPLTILCVLVVLGLLGYGIYRLFRGGGVLAFAILWFFVGIFPSSNIPAPIGIPTAERFLYLPMLGVALVAGTALARVWRAGTAGRVAVAAFVVLLGILSFDRSTVWRTERGLWEGILARFDSPRARDWRADTTREKASKLLAKVERLEKAGREEEIERLEREAQRLLRASERDYDRAIALWQGLPSAAPATAVVRAGRALTWYEQGHYARALNEANAVLQTPVIQLVGRANLVKALCLYKLGDYRAAAFAIEAAIHFEDEPLWRRKAAAIYEKLAEWYNAPERKNHARTHQALRRSFELLPDPERNEGVAVALQDMETELNDALAPLVAKVENRTATGEDYLRIALRLSAHGFYERAAATWEQILSPQRSGEEPDPVVLDLFARFYWENRDTLEGYDRAREVYERIEEIDPEFEGLDEAFERIERGRESLLESLTK